MGFIWDTFGGQIIVAVIGLAAGVLGTWMMVGTRSRYVTLIAWLLDEITDDLVAKYPGNKVLNTIDDAIDKLMAKLEIEDMSTKRFSMKNSKAKMLLTDAVAKSKKLKNGGSS